jgi:hypothetical protein
MVFPPIRPSLARSPSEAVPTMRLATTRGMMIIVIRRMNAVPMGSRATRTVVSPWSSKTLATKPMTAPRTSPRRILV